MSDLKFTIRLGDIFEIETDKAILYLSATVLAGEGNNAYYLELQAMDKKGKLRMIEMRQIKEMPKGWKKSGYRRVKFNTP